MLYSICIATYRRREQLSCLLTSIVNQVLPENLYLQVLVVDNDIKSSAKEIVECFKSNNIISFEYFVQPSKNISLTRNLGVKNAKGDYILFIDDDEIATKGWIMEYWLCMKKYKPDGIFGLVIPKYHESTPKWIKKGKFFSKELSPTGEIARSTRTSNCIVRAELIKDEPGPFDPSYGLTGGEDTQLFERLRLKGARFISSQEAPVEEFIPPDRTRISWLIKKAFQTGNTYTRRTLELSSKRLITSSLLLFKALIYGIASLFTFFITLPIKRYSVKWLMKVASNCGHALAVMGFYYRGYK